MWPEVPIVEASTVTLFLVLGILGVLSPARSGYNSRARAVITYGALILIMFVVEVVIAAAFTARGVSDFLFFQYLAPSLQASAGASFAGTITGFLYPHLVFLKTRREVLTTWGVVAVSLAIVSWQMTLLLDSVLRFYPSSSGI